MRPDTVLERLKQTLGVSKDKEVAEFLSMSPAALSARLARNSFPVKDLRALAQQRPELGIDVDYVLGVSPGPSNRPHCCQRCGPACGMKAQQIQYALAKQVPDIGQRGCRIETAYGAIEVPAGALARCLADYLQRELTPALAQAQRDEELAEQRRELRRQLRTERWAVA